MFHFSKCLEDQKFIEKNTFRLSIQEDKYILHLCDYNLLHLHSHIYQHNQYQKDQKGMLQNKNKFKDKTFN